MSAKPDNDPTQPATRQQNQGKELFRLYPVFDEPANLPKTQTPPTSGEILAASSSTSTAATEHTSPVLKPKPPSKPSTPSSASAVTRGGVTPPVPQTSSSRTPSTTITSNSTASSLATAVTTAVFSFVSSATTPSTVTLPAASSAAGYSNPSTTPATTMSVSTPASTSASISAGSSSTSTTMSTTTTTSILDGFVNPATFSGLPSEDGVAWMTYITRWAEYRGINNANLMKMLPLLLRGPAIDWWDSLLDVEHADLAAVREAFKNRFFPSDLTKWQTMSELWSRKQGPQEGVDIYVAEMRKLARTIGMDNKDELRYAITKGLRPEIRKHVLHANVTEISELIREARISEQALLAGDQDDLTAAILRIEEKLSASKGASGGGLMPISDQNQQRTLEADGRARSPSPARPRPGSPFQRQQPWGRHQQQQQHSRSSSGAGFGQHNRWENRNQNWQAAAAPNQRYATSTPRQVRFFDQATEGSEYMSNNGAGGTNACAEQSQPPRQQPQRNYDDGNPARRNQQQTGNIACYRCGSYYHDAGNCRAYNLTCRFCNKLGHFARVCRAARMYRP